MLHIVPSTGIAMPTDAEWGRLYKFDGTGDSGLIMPPRSYYFRNFFAGNWYDLSFGMIHSTCGLANDTAALANERLDESRVSNLFHFGMSQSFNGNINVPENPYFLGLRGALDGVTEIVTSTSMLQQVFPHLVNAGISQIGGSAISIKLSQGITATPFSILGVRLIFNPAQGKVYLRHATDTGIALADEADNVIQLTEYLAAISGSTVGADASFNITNLSAYKTFYLYWPYLLNRMKLQCVGVVKNA